MMCRTNLVSALIFVPLSLVACDRGRDTPPAQAAPTAEPSPQAAPQASTEAVAASASAAPTPPPAPPKPDKVDAASLKAGAATMSPRGIEGAKVLPNERSRYPLHPGETKSTSIEFDVKGLTSLELAPFIEDLAADKGCVGNPQAGVVRVTWALDGVKQPPVTVDRNYNDVVKVDVAKKSRLKIEVDKGNEVTWCDWFSIGFLNVQ